MFLKFILDIDRSPNQNRPSLILDLSRSGFWDLRVKKIYLHITGQVKSVSIQNLVVLSQKLNELSSIDYLTELWYDYGWILGFQPKGIKLESE